MSADAAALDRLPWLSDEPAPQWAGRRGGALLPLAAGALAVAGGGAFWAGTRSFDEIAPTSPRQQSSTTVLLPPARPAARVEGWDPPNVPKSAVRAVNTASRSQRSRTERRPRLATPAASTVVEVGAFGSVHGAERGWPVMVRAYPQMAHLPAVVGRTRNSHGRQFFRFRVGVPSKARSGVLCQRMRTINLSCAMLAKAKVAR